MKSFHVVSASIAVGAITIVSINALFPVATAPAQILPPAGYGTINPSVTESNIESTICKPGWTATIRPSASYTSALKATQIKDFGYSDTNPRDYEEDHVISLELGGAPADPLNLWPQPYAGTLGARQKDTVETYLKNQVCDGTITLEYAQNIIKTDWAGAYLLIKNISVAGSNTDN